MAMTAALAVDGATGKMTLTVNTDSRNLEVDIRNGATGETLVVTGTWPITIVNPGGRTWMQVSDDGTKAIFTG